MGIKDNKKYFFRYIENKRKANGSVRPLLNISAQLVTNTQEKTELLND